MSKQSALDKLEIKYSALQKREKILVLVLAMLFSAFIAYELLVTPESNKSENLEKTIAATISRIGQVEQDLTKMNIALANDPNEPLQDRIARLNQRINSLDEQFTQQLNELIPASTMPKVLDSLFTKAEKLTLLEMSSVFPVDLFSNDKNMQTTRLYQHGVKLTFNGNYFAVLEFLEQIERMPYQLYWHSFNYDVEEYPTARIELELFTLSTNEAFIGV